MIADDLALALELAGVAAELSVEAFQDRDRLGVETKADGSPVTEADRHVELVLRELLSQRRAGDLVVGEEFGGQAGKGRCWYIDPIDGTSASVSGEDRWSTLVSLAEGGVVTVGVVDFPVRGRRFWAAQGMGAFADGIQIRVSDVEHLDAATVCDDYHHNIERQTIRHPLVQLASRCAAVHPHEGHSMLVVATGQAELALGSGGGPWDYAPFVILLSESGGQTTDLRGQDRFDSGSLLATNGLLHSQALDALNANPT